MQTTGAQAGGNDATLQQALQNGMSGSGSTHEASQSASPTGTSTASSGNTSLPATSTTAPPDASQSSAMSGAQLIQSMHQSEMRVGMNSAEFGSISISTSVSHQALSASISLDHADLGRALAAHLPAIEEKLGSAYGLHAKVELRDSNTSSQSDSASQQSGGNRQNQQNGSSSSSISPSTLPMANMATVATSTAASLATDTARLDIRI